MLDLSRTIRFCLNGPIAENPGAKFNGYSAWPAMRGMGRFYQLTVRCRGQVNAQTGYFLNITQIDRVVHERVLPCLTNWVTSEKAAAEVPLGQVMKQMFELAGEGLHATVESLTWELTPFYHLKLERSAMNQITLCQNYEFSASHRLHARELSDAENREIFGKCNHPSGHGHNYRLEVCVRAPIDDTGHVIAVEKLDALVHQTVIEKVDHRHLNMDVAEFAKLNPTVEHIAMVIYRWLLPETKKLGVHLEEVRVWETPKTVCIYRG